MSCAPSMLAAIVVFSTAGTAFAQEAPRAGTGHVPPPPDLTAQPTVALGAGVDSFVGKELRGLVGPGVTWTVRAAMGGAASVRLELVYAGSSQSIDRADMEGARLVGHGVHGLLRINVVPNRVLEPFFFLGGGWTRFHVSGAAGTLRTPDHMLEIPFGFGAARRLGRLVVDARAGFSVMTGANLVPPEDPAAPEGESMHRAGVRVSLGLEL